jgi:hypothetical protein
LSDLSKAFEDIYESDLIYSQLDEIMTSELNDDELMNIGNDYLHDSTSDLELNLDEMAIITRELDDDPNNIGN